MPSDVFDKAPEREYRRRSYWDRILHRPMTTLAVVIAIVAVTVIAVTLVRSHARPQDSATVTSDS